MVRLEPERTLVRLGVVLLVSMLACSGSSREPGAEDSPRPSPAEVRDEGLCQPFPDRLIDDFIAAYNDRDRDTLKTLVDADHVVDVVAAAYAGTSTFDDVAEWAEAGWRQNDRMNLVGYSAFYPTKRGFQMLMTRRSTLLKGHGIKAVSTTLDAISRGCLIESLEMSGIVHAKGEPCAFYAEFGTVDDIAANEPSSCMDGSGDHARTDHAAVWTGHRALMWGGVRGGQFVYGDVVADGLSYDPVADQWSDIPAPSLPAFTPQVGAWTGTELLVLGGKIRGQGVVGAAFDPHLSSWRPIDFPYRNWTGFEGVWTGSELIIWGGPDHSERPRRRGVVYDPPTDSWRETPPAPIGGRWSHAATWTGTEMIVWGGSDANTDLADGAAYNPASDSWRTIAPAPISARQWLPITWTGSEMIVWGGSSYSRNRADGAAYDPVADAWRKLAPAPIKGRHYHSSIWTGSEVIVFGGYNYHRTFRDGAAYDPASDSWRRISRSPLAPRCCHSALWTGKEMLTFGGSPDLGHMALGDGALYDPELNRWRRVIPELAPQG